MEPIQIPIYRETFEQAEIDGLIAFYGSPVGQAFVNKMPTVSQKGIVARGCRRRRACLRGTSQFVIHLSLQ